MRPAAAGPSVRRNFLWSLTGSGVYVASQWLLLVLLAKAGNDTEATRRLGQFALSLAVLQPLFQVAAVDLRQVQATDGNRQRSPGLYLLARGLGAAGVGAAACIVALLWGRDGSTSATLVLLGVAKAVEALSDVAYGRFEQRERMDWVARSQMLRGPLGALGFGLALWNTGRVAVAAAALGAAWGAVFLLHDLPLALRRDGEDPPPHAWERPRVRAAVALLRRTLPLGLATGFISLSVNVPAYLLEWSEGTAAVGIYGSLAYFVSALRMAAMAAGTALAPRVGRAVARGDRRRIRVLVAALVAACAAPGVLAAAVAAAIGGPILSVVYRPSFAGHGPTLAALLSAAAVGFAAYALRITLTAAGRYGSQLPPVIAMLAATAGAGFVLVPRYGILGAALSLGCGRSVQTAVFAAMVARHLRSLPAGPASEGELHDPSPP